VLSTWGVDLTDRLAGGACATLAVAAHWSYLYPLGVAPNLMRVISVDSSKLPIESGVADRR
jgi:hypothetical protein